MKFFVAALLLPLAGAVQLQYDNHYDDPNGSMTTVACSDGLNGLITRFGFHKFGDIPHFPHIGAAAAVTQWNSPQCGTCWKLTFRGKSINVLAIDVAGTGFNVAQAAMDELTNGQAVALGRVDVTASQVAASNCGL